MVKRILIAALPFALSACGGGGSSNSTSVATPSSFTPATPQTGDTYTYARTVTPTGSVNTPYQDTTYERVTSTDATGAFILNGTDQFRNYPYQLDAKRNVLAQQNCTFSQPLNALPTPWYVGETSNQSVSGTCLQDSSYQLQQSTTAQSYESVTVPAGTFNTLKVQTTSTLNLQYYPAPTSAFSDLLSLMRFYSTAYVPMNISEYGYTVWPIYSYTDINTCWYDVISGFPVQCQGKRTYSNLDISQMIVFGSTSNYAKVLTSTTHASDAAFTLTGRDNSGNVFPWLNLTPGQFNNLTIQSGTQIELDTTQPVTWTINKTESSGDSISSVINIPVTTQTTPTRLNLSSQLAASATGSQANVTIKAALIADPTQSVTFTLTILP